MNKELLTNILLYQDNLEVLNKELFNNFIRGLESLYEFLVQQKDFLMLKQETLNIITNNEYYNETFQNINAINTLQITRDTKFKLLKVLVENNIKGKDSNICAFCLYFFWAKQQKLLKSQQKELLTLIKRNNSDQYLNSGAVVISFLLSTNVIKEKTFVENVKGFKFKVFHELNKSRQIDLAGMSQNNFIHYLGTQFITYNLKSPMSFAKNDVSIKEAVMPYLEQPIDNDKKNILALFLDMIKEKLNLDNQNKEFIEKLVLNTKLNQKEIEVSNKPKKPKI